ncbi:MAG TPA: hypothetical protein VMX38_07835 [Verrucomicrobiae bacterium]|jgi:hypothetical protein|nr:hypothetical protein [Verrucomicrobiae bacterium]
MTTPIPITTPVTQFRESVESKKASARYEEAYLHAHSVVQAGDAIQTAGWILGILLFCGAIFTAHTATIIETPAKDWLAPGGLILAAIVAVFCFWMVGMLLCARGHDLMASLDSAVNSSPFLSNAQRAKVIFPR